MIGFDKIGFHKYYFTTFNR